MSDKTIVLSFSYEWKLSYSMLEKCKLFSEGEKVGKNEVESERFGHFKAPEKFFLKLTVTNYDYKASVNIYLQLSNENDIDFVIKNYKLTMYTSNDKTGISIDTRENVEFPFYGCKYISSSDSKANSKWVSLIHSKPEVIFLCEIQYSYVDYNGFCGDTYHFRELSKNLKLTREKKKFADIILRVSDGEEFPAHKIILASRSPVFETMFSNLEFQENKENLICFEDIDSELMKHLLDYIYYGDISFEDEIASQLILPAHKNDPFSLNSDQVSVKIFLKLSNDKDQDFKIESCKITMFTSNNDTGLPLDTQAIRLGNCYGTESTIPDSKIWFTIADSKSKVTFHCEIRYSFVDCKGICSKSYHFVQLSNSLKLTLEKKQFTDIIIRTSDQKEFPAHKIILASRSPVFATMFSNPGFIETKENLVWIKDIDSILMKPLLDYIYFGDISFNEEIASKLIIPAHKYSIKPLVKICGRIMLNKLKIESAAEILYIADTYDLYEMKIEVVHFICQNKELFDKFKNTK
ncbi:hypothetical protein BLOT_001426 [Blomia tropicalis]|nr:hypothetical protein BLOT_001426 [Blomia tropicalis]